MKIFKHAKCCDGPRDYERNHVFFMEIEAADALLFQRWLTARQYPPDCRATVGVLTRAGLKPESNEQYPGDYFYGLGLGSQMASLRFNFVDALLKNRIYHFPTSHYVNPLRCASQRFDCYFEPPTNCSREGPSSAGSGSSATLVTHRTVVSAPLLWCFELPRRRLSRLAGLHAVHTEAWYHGQLSAFLFRPNAAVRAYRAELLPRLAFDMNFTRAGVLDRDAGVSGSLHNASTCVAMHIRRTDKFKGRRREDLKSAVGFSGFSRAFKSWAYWNSPRPTAQSRVLLGSEDPHTFGAMPALLAPSLSYWIPGRDFVMSSFKDINDHNDRLVGRYASLLKRMAAARAEGAAAVAALEAAGATKDEGMALIVQILLMGECESFFGSFASNVAVLVHDLMHAHRVAKRERLHVIDVNGRSYCGCGASFCMKLEKRATREPRRTMRSMVEAFRGSNINAI